MTSATQTSATRRAQPARGGLKYLVTAATLAAVVGGWGLLAEPLREPVEQASAGPAVAAPAERLVAAEAGPAPAGEAQTVAPAGVAGLRSVTASQPVIRTRSSR